ncbi:ester cyclase [Amycolatopsis rhabdoformis]|uniref:Ester cyclase n=1 Tax=Amycolatopsis rhabdoformis TaxID=1448059 RepID=A0ABZ1IE91_9PSEU|nr:ester cyclase [Amycolatopsis rhabdoformis]WSE32003.1 ester cyclase [Amycolatopsis rhabdoformis]
MHTRSLVTNLVGGDYQEAEYTEEERRNLDLVRKFRSVPLEERAAYLKPGATVNRVGMASLADLSGLGMGGYRNDSLPDRHDVIEDIVAKGDRVWAVWSLTATHTGELYGFPATGNRIDITEMAIWRFEAGLVAEHWYFADDFALLRQLGAIPEFTDYTELTRGRWRTAD